MNKLIIFVFLLSCCNTDQGNLSNAEFQPKVYKKNKKSETYKHPQTSIPSLKDSLTTISEEKLLDISINDKKDTKENTEKNNPFENLINIADVDSTILVDLKYSSEDNFLKKDVYGDLEDAYLQKEVAIMLAKSQKKLKNINPDYSLLIYDSARPLTVQQKMWNLVQGTAKEKYVANPKKGSIHNYGAAVDVTMAYKNKAMDLGTPFDFFGELAHPVLEEKFLASGKLSPQQISNRELLRNVMEGSGFQGITIEWWHFNAFSNEVTKKKYEIIK